MMFERPSSTLRETSALARILRPAVGFSHPSDVVKDPHLSPEEKRFVLSSWASDACAVEDRPGWRRALGSDVAVPLADIRAALARLDLPPRAQALEPPSFAPNFARAQGGHDVRHA
jgi:hypothetical protein